MVLTESHRKPPSLKLLKLLYGQYIQLVLLYYILYIIKLFIGRPNRERRTRGTKLEPQGVPEDPQGTPKDCQRTPNAFPRCPKGSQGTPTGVPRDPQNPSKVPPSKKHSSLKKGFAKRVTFFTKSWEFRDFRRGPGTPKNHFCIGNSDKHHFGTFWEKSIFRLFGFQKQTTFQLPRVAQW